MFIYNKIQKKAIKAHTGKLFLQAKNIAIPEIKKFVLNKLYERFMVPQKHRPYSFAASYRADRFYSAFYPYGMKEH